MRIIINLNPIFWGQSHIKDVHQWNYDLKISEIDNLLKISRHISHPNLLVLKGDNYSPTHKHDWVKNPFVKKLYRFCFIFCIMAFMPQDTISILSSIWYIILTTWFQHPNHLTNLTTLTIQPINQINCPNQPNFPDHLTIQNMLTSD